MIFLRSSIWYQIFQSNTLYTVVGFHIFRYTINNLIISSKYFYFIVIYLSKFLRWSLIMIIISYNRKIDLWLIGLVGGVFANRPGDLGSIPGCVIPKTLKMVLDTSLLNTQQYKVRIKGKVEQSWEKSSALPYTLV